MHKSGLYVTTLAIVIGCGAAVETVDSNSKAPATTGSPAGDEVSPGSYNFNPPPPPDLRAPPEDDGGGGNGDDPNLQLSDRGIVFSQTCSGEHSDHALTLTNTGGSTLSIQGLAISGAGYSLTGAPGLPARIEPGHALTVHVRFTPPGESLTPFEGNLRIASNDPGSPVINVVLSGLALPTTFTLSPRTLHFGDVADGDVVTQRLTVTNTGRCTGHAHSARITGNLSSDVSTGTLPGSVAPGASEGLNVRLACNGEDDDLQATLRLLDLGGRSIGSVQLRGTCLGD